MPLDYKIDFQSENFDWYFSMFVAQMTPKQKMELPQSISFRLSKKQGRSSFFKLSFYQKWFVLFRAMNKRMFIVIEDDNEGLSEKDFIEWKRQQKNRKFEDISGSLVARSIATLGNADLCDWLGFVNNNTISPNYQYGLKIKNAKPIEFPKFQKEFLFFSKSLLKYEGAKKKIMVETGLTMGELYVLLFLFDGKEHSATPVYENVLKGSFQSSKTTVLRAFKFLKEKNLLQQTGKTNMAVYKITPLGKVKVNEIIHKYIIP